MKNSKFILGFSVFGFLLSLFSGISAQGRSAGMHFLMALIFGAIFGALAFVIGILAEKFLASEVAFSAESAPVSAGSSSHAVDITIQDEELPAEEHSSAFFVGNSHRMLNETDVASSGAKTSSGAQTSVPVQNVPVQKEELASSATVSAAAAVIEANRNARTQNAELSSVMPSVNQNAASESSATLASGVANASQESEVQNTGFVPVSLTENVKNFSSVEAVSAQDEKNMQNDGADLDVLPDLGDVSDIASSARQSVVVEVSDFPSDETSGGSEKTVEEVTEGKDAALMAKAISTLLAKE